MADGVTIPTQGTGDTTPKIATDEDVTNGHVQIIKLAVDTDGSAAVIPAHATDGLKVNLGADNDVTVNNAGHDNLVSTNNSTTSLLTANTDYTGTGEDVSAYTSVTITVEASHDSDVDGMRFEFSSDNTNWDDVYNFTYTAANGARRFQFPVTAQYFRTVYQNAGTTQTHFRLQTILHRNNVLTSVHRLVDDMSPDRSAQVVKTALFAQVGGSGDFTAVASNASGKLQVAGDVVGDNTPADAYATPTDALDAHALLSVYNGATHDLVREGATAGSILVDGSNVTQPVSGTITETNSAAILADTAAMDTNLATLAGAVAAGQYQVDIVADGAGLATAANQLPDGHNVTVDNATLTVTDNADAFQIGDGTDPVAVLIAGADATSNAENQLVSAAMGYVYNGTSWDRMREGASAGSLLVDLGSNNDVTISSVTPDLMLGTDFSNVFSTGAVAAAHDATHPANAVQVGGNAVALDASPTAVAAGDLTEAKYTRDGQQWTIPGHPNMQTLEYRATTAQTNDIIIAAPGAGQHTVLTGITAVVGASATAKPDVRVGWGAAVPTEPTDGNTAADMVLAHPGIEAGSGIVQGWAGAPISISPANQPLRITNTEPTTDEIKVLVSYYTLDG